MEAKEAVVAAKTYYSEIFAEPPTLEEIWFDDTALEWCVTVGRRRMVTEKSAPAFQPFGPRELKEIVDYKVVRIDDKNGKLVSIKNRDGARAA